MGYDIVLTINTLQMIGLHTWNNVNDYYWFFLILIFNILKFILFTSNKHIYLGFYYNIYYLINKGYLALTKKSNKGIRKTELLILVYCAYIIIIDLDILYRYIFSFFFLTGVLIKLIKMTKNWVNNHELKQYFPMYHNIVKYMLFGLLILNLLVLIIIGQKLLILIITYFKGFFLNMNIVNKLKDFKLSLDYKWVKNKDNKPKKPNVNFFFDLKNKKKSKKRASSLKEKILDLQKKNLNKDYSNTTFKQESFSQKRNWKESINIEDKPKFTIHEQLNNVKYEYKAYNNQEKKFKKIVIDINKEKEEFFPNESKSLFKEYVSVIKILKKNLKSVEKILSQEK